MAFVSRKLWRQKPPPSGMLDWSHPLAVGLVSAVALNEGTGIPRDLAATREFSIAGTPPWVGQGMQFSVSGDTLTTPDNPVMRLATPSLFLQMTKLGQASNNYCVFAGKPSSTANYVTPSFGLVNGASYHNVSAKINAGGSAKSSTTYAAAVGKSIAYGMSYDLMQLSFFADGKLIGAPVAATAALMQATTPFGFGQAAAGYICNAVIECCYLFDRPMSFDQYAELRDNPWQIFQPIRRVLYVDMGGGFSVPMVAQALDTAAANPSLGVVSSLAGLLSGAAAANTICGTVQPATGETAASCDATPTLGTNLPAIAESASNADISDTCGTVASMVATGSVTASITPPEPEEMPYIPPWRMASVPFSGSRLAAVPAASRVASVPAASRVAAVSAASRVAAVPAASRVSPARIE